MDNKAKILLIALIIVIIIVAIISVLIKKPKIEESPIAGEIYGFSGIVKQIGDKDFLVEAKVLLADLNQEPMIKTLKVSVVNETKILRLEFPKEIPPGSTDPIFPKETEVSLRSLLVGDKVDIETLGNVSENIRNNGVITAKVVSIIK